MLFIDNKYTRWYNAIITNAQQQNRKKLKRNQPGYVYYEKHHIIPTSLGGIDTKDNWTNLTAREHFICHWLLTKMTIEKARKKMIYALRMMQADNQNLKRYKTKITARVYSKIREEYSQIASEDRKGKPSTKKGKTNKEMYGIEKSVELSKRQSDAMKGRNNGKTYEEMYGIETARQVRHLRAVARQGKPNVNRGKVLGTQPKIECPHCGTIGGNSNMKRWHFNRCKHLLNVL